MRNSHTDSVFCAYQLRVAGHWRNDDHCSRHQDRNDPDPPLHQAGNINLPLWRRRLAILLDREWTEPLPIYTFLIEHDEGLILVDTGESARASARGYFPWWSPFFQLAIDIHVEPDDEIGPRLRSTGIDPGKDLRMVVLTHLHHDHADGLSYFRDTDILVSTENYQAAQGVKGALLGANPSHFPSWFEPRQTELTGRAVSSFDHTLPLTERITLTERAGTAQFLAARRGGVRAV